MFNHEKFIMYFWWICISSQLVFLCTYPSCQWHQCTHEVVEPTHVHTPYRPHRSKSGTSTEVSYAYQCNGVVGCEAPVIDIWVFWLTIHAETNANAYMIFTRHAAFHACLCWYSHCSKCSWCTHQQNLKVILSTWKTWIPPNWSSMQGGKWCWFLNLWSKSSSVILGLN